VTGVKWRGGNDIRHLKNSRKRFESWTAVGGAVYCEPMKSFEVLVGLITPSGRNLLKSRAKERK